MLQGNYAAGVRYSQDKICWLEDMKESAFVLRKMLCYNRNCEDKMRKIIVFLLILFSSVEFLFAGETNIDLPDGVSPFAFVFDKNELYPVPKDYFKISNSYNIKGIFKIYACNETKHWIYLGDIDFTTFVDTKKINEKITDYRYFCIDCPDERIRYEVLSRYNDIYVKAKKDDVLRINDKVIDKGFYVVDYSALGEVDDYYKIVNETKKSNFKIQLYVFDPRKENWIYAGEGVLKGYGDVDTIRSEVDPGDYKIVALISESKMNFSCKAHARHDDLYIELCDAENDLELNSDSIDEIESKLKNLKNLYEKGYIDADEYKTKKKQILGL